MVVSLAQVLGGERTPIFLVRIGTRLALYFSYDLLDGLHCFITPACQGRTISPVPPKKVLLGCFQAV
jgi:hypothetical protein